MRPLVLEQDEGVLTLFKGLELRIVRRTAMAAFNWSFFEEVRAPS